MIQQIFMWIGVIVTCITLFFALGMIFSYLWIKLNIVYSHTYLYYCIDTFRVWYKYWYKKNRINLSPSELKAFKENKVISRMPQVFKKVWIRILDQELERQRQEVISYGELPLF